MMYYHGKIGEFCPLFAPENSRVRGGETMPGEKKKELRKLSKAELILVMQEQEKENDRLRERIALLEKQLYDRKINIESAGSIAEAALKLSGIFEAAEIAAGLYKDNLSQDSEYAELATEKKERDR